MRSSNTSVEKTAGASAGASTGVESELRGDARGGGGTRTNIEGSTKLWENDPEAMQASLARHDQILAGAIDANEGHVFKTVGDAFCATFPTAPDALEAQHRLLSTR